MLLRSALSAVTVLSTLVPCPSQAGADVLRVKLDNLTSMRERAARKIEMREFLWSHWVHRKSATLALTAVSKEGKVTHSEYRIILLPGNTLMLKVTFVRDSIGYQGQVIPKPDGGYEAYTVDRVQSENPFGVGPKAKVTVLSADSVVAAEKYWLRFKGWDDVLITYF